MKLKYYLRGLGVGVLLTTIILSIANADNKPMTDAQVRQRALELGMIESDSLRLTDVGESTVEPEIEATLEASETSEPIASTKDTQGESESSPESLQASTESSPESLQTSMESQVSTESSSSQTVPSGESAISTEAESSVPVEEGEQVLFTIKSGDSSYSVSKALAAAGLVEDAVEFDNYLCNYGYSRKIRTGTYEIVPGMTYEEIAKTISQ